MTKLQHRDKRIGLPSIISNVANNKNEELFKLTSFQKPQLQYVSVFFFVSVVLIRSFHVLISYFLVSLKLVAVVTV